MNRFKNAAFSVLIAGLAFGISAFTTLKKQTKIYYYKTDMNYPDANDPRGYRYYAGNRCEAVGELCRAQWNIGSNPIPITDGQPLPLTGVTFQVATEIVGHFE